MNKQNFNKKDMLVFLKRYGYIIVLAVTLLITAVVLALTIPTGGVNPVDNNPITLSNPILNANVAKGYTDTTLMYNSTLKQWEAHKAITFTAGSNADVYAVLDGTVKEIYTNYLEGTVVVVEHQGNLKSIYGSLSSSTNVNVGDIVRKGVKIGQASNTANAEYALGTHLRFQLLENNVPIDPSSYLNIQK